PRARALYHVLMIGIIGGRELFGFFFQAEDGIRDGHVTGVQTCALPIFNDFEGSAPRPGEIRRLRITEAHDYDVLGTLLPATEAEPRPITAGLINIEPLVTA